MASFRKRSNGWQSRVRRNGYHDLTKTFSARSKANEWARQAYRRVLNFKQRSYYYNL